MKKATTVCSLAVATLLPLFAWALAPADPAPAPSPDLRVQAWHGNALCYSGYRLGQGPHTQAPSQAQVLEDLRIVERNWHLIRVYGSDRHSEDVLEVIRREKLPIRVLLGIWLDGKLEGDNATQVATGIRLANAYPDVVVAVSVGNEAFVSWSDHRMTEERGRELVRQVKAAVRCPVTVADDQLYWREPGASLAEAVDFISMHSYPAWGKHDVDTALPGDHRRLRARPARSPRQDDRDHGGRLAHLHGQPAERAARRRRDEAEALLRGADQLGEGEGRDHLRVRGLRRAVEGQGDRRALGPLHRVAQGEAGDAGALPRPDAGRADLAGLRHAAAARGGREMSERAGFVAGAPLRRDPRPVEGALVELGGERFYRIANHDAMAPFFMSLVSDSDHWLFASSNGALTAGRRDPDRALFPYYTDDRIHDSQDQTGAKTLLRVARAGTVSLWEPFSPRYEGLYRLERNLYKSVVGNKLLFEERNADLGLVFRYAWTSSERFGFVRSAALVNTAEEPVAIELLDGVQNLLPHGLTRRFQMEYSTLADGYKEAELDAATGLGIFRMSSVPTDKAEPSEALRATTVWSLGLEPAIRLLSATQLDRFRRGLGVEQETNVRGRRGAYFVQASVSLPKGGEKDWLVVCDVEQDAGAVRATLQRLATGAGLLAEVAADVERGARNLVRIVASADGLQTTSDELSAWRHFSNVLFNVMRGGIPDRGYEVSRDDFASFLRTGKPPRRRAARGLRLRPAGDAAARPAAGARPRAGRPRPRAARPRVPAAHLQPPPRRPEPALEPCSRSRCKDEQGEKRPQLRGQLARHLPELGGAGPLASPATSRA